LHSTQGEIIWEIEFRGSKRAEVEHHGFGIYRYMAMLREAGLEFVGMSSVGPSIAIISTRGKKEVSEILDRIGLKIAGSFMISLRTGSICCSGD